METPDSNTRQLLLNAALKRFADHGYAGTSVQDIVDDARVTKPTLYYYFGNKAGLYQALVDYAYDERYRLIIEAESRGANFKEKSLEIYNAIFDFLHKNREVMRIAFFTVFAAPGEVPEEIKYKEKGNRNLEFVQKMVKRAQDLGELRRDLTPHDVAMTFFGLMNVHVMTFLVRPEAELNQRTAEKIVNILFTGVGTK